MVDLGLYENAEEAEREARRIVAAMDPTVGVGARHHTVPRMLLLPFSTNEQVVVRDLQTGATRTANINDLAIKDFYTAIVDSPTGSAEQSLDGSIEQLLGTVEGRAATVIRRIEDSPDLALSDDERYALAQFVSFQVVRGVRSRMEVELMGEYYAKTMLAASRIDRQTTHKAAVGAVRRAGHTPARGNGGWQKRSRHRRVSDAELSKLVIRPHPNEHIRTLGGSSRAVFDHIVARPVTVVDLDQPLLVLGDEPVVSIGGPARAHQPECSLTNEQRNRALRNAVKVGKESRELIHIYPTRPKGFALATQIAMPIGPSRFVLYGAPERTEPSYVRLDSDASFEAAADLNDWQIQQAYLWVVAHPNHLKITEMPMPPPAPLFEVCDGDSAASRALSSAPSPARPQRIRRT